MNEGADRKTAGRRCSKVVNDRLSKGRRGPVALQDFIQDRGQGMQSKKQDYGRGAGKL